jgi:hypothetical protein
VSTAIACVLASVAVALVATSGALASELSWSAPQKIDATESPYLDPSLQVSCATTSFCVAVDKNTNAMIFGGSSWTAPTSVKGSFLFPLYSVSCPTASFCVAGGSGNALTYSAGSWSAPSHVESALDSVSCPSASFCVGVAGGEAITYNGSSWSAPSDIDGSAELGSVSCPSSSFCMAVDYEGHELSYNGSSWSAPADIDGSEGIGGVSCQSSSFCMAVDWSGNALTYNGSSWTAASNIDGNALTSVSCPSSSFCAAVGDSGDALTYNGSSWTNSTGVYGGSEGASVSCVSSSFCVATEAHGNALIYGEHEASGGGGSKGGGSGGAPSSGGGGAGTGKGGVTLHVGGTLPVSHNAVHVSLQCTGSGTCTGKVTLTTDAHGAHGSRLARSSLRSRAKGQIIGRHAFSIAAGKSTSVEIHLNAAGKKALGAAHGKLKAHLSLSGTASGKAVNESEAVTLKTGGSSGRRTRASLWLGVLPAPTGPVSL